MEIVNPINSYNENKMFKASYGGNKNDGVFYPLGRSERFMGFSPLFPSVILITLVT